MLGRREEPGSPKAEPGTEISAVCDLRVRGMDCASCAAAVEGALGQLDGVLDVHVDVMSGRVRVGYADRQLTRSDMSRAIARAGYRVEHGNGRRVADITNTFEGDPERAESFWTRRGRFVAIGRARPRRMPEGVQRRDIGSRSAL